MTNKPVPWQEFERFGHLIQAAPWRFAYTMAENPHHYTLREEWDDETFDWAIQFVREYGYPNIYEGNRYTQLDVNEHFYWTMGAPIEETILMNRKRRVFKADYDPISYKYDTLFRDDAAAAEENELLTFLKEHVRNLEEKHVLDVGCGTGLALRLFRPRSYLGIDPSAGMLGYLRHRHPDAGVIRTDLTRFCPPEYQSRFDLILALFGVGSYLSDEEAARIPTLLAPGGTAVIMYYTKPSSELRTYRATRVCLPHNEWKPEILPGEEHAITEFRAILHKA